MQKINKNLLCICVIAMIIGISTCCYASTEGDLLSDTPLSEQHIDKLEPNQQHHYDVSLSMLRNLSKLENVSSNEDSILIPGNLRCLSDTTQQEEVTLSNGSNSSYLFLWHDSQGNVNLIDEQGFLNQIGKEGIYYWVGPSGKQCCITKEKNSIAIGVE